MNAGLPGRMARREDGRRRVSLVTRLVAIGATAVAVVAGVAFAQQPTGGGAAPATTPDNTPGNSPDTTPGPGTGSPDDGSGWNSPSITVPDSGPAHGSSGGS